MRTFVPSRNPKRTPVNKITWDSQTVFPKWEARMIHSIRLQVLGRGENVFVTVVYPDPWADEEKVDPP